MTKYDALKQYFGHSAFRPGQEGVIDALCAGQDVLCVMPTGAGKSLCYQIPALVTAGTTIVVSPLISLMKDQVEGLVQSGVSAAYVNSSLTQAQYGKVLQALQAGAYRLVYVAPERLLTPDFLSVCQGLQVPFLVVDEAHCVSQWGQNFRPSYLRIAEFTAALPVRPAVAAFTATATGRVKEDIRLLLGLRNPFCMTTGFDRPNLFFAVEKPKSKSARLLEWVREHPGRAGIVYAATRKNVEEVYRFLGQNGVSVTRYHAGLTDEERRQNQEDFLYGRADLIVATNAFGMGIDKSDVSYVLHYNMPKDLESYYQEAGRAGRDGEKAECVLLYSPQDVMTNRYLIARSEEGTERTEQEQAALQERDLERLKQMTFYCTTGGCLRQFILRYFGENDAAPCGNCSSCLARTEEVDITVDVQKILSCILRTGQRYGRKMICQILRGSRSERLISLGLETQSTYGLLRTMPEQELEERLDFLEAQGILIAQGGEYPVLKVTAKSRGVLYEKQTLQMKTLRPEPPRTKKAKGGSGNGTTGDGALFEQLRQLRFQLAQEQKIPAYLVFTDAALRDMCAKCPRTPSEFLEVSGVGQAKAEKYGAAFLALLRTYAEGIDHH